MKRGFTLVELAIVLVIVGLLIGGVLIAQSIVDSAKVNRLVRDLEQYEIATNLFKQKFKYYPGDSSYFTPVGNEDNILNGTGCEGIYDDQELHQFWAHLSQSNMLNADYPAYQPTSGCGGTHSSGDFQRGEYTPYTELTNEDAISLLSGLNSYYIFPNKTSAANNVYLYLVLDPLITLALENKMNAQAFDGSEQQIGLVNPTGLGSCYGGTYVCADGDSIGQLFYYIAPID